MSVQNETSLYRNTCSRWKFVPSDEKGTYERRVEHASTRYRWLNRRAEQNGARRRPPPKSGFWSWTTLSRWSSLIKPTAVEQVQNLLRSTPLTSP